MTNEGVVTNEIDATTGPDVAPPREADMDGSLHVTGECCGRGSILGRTCRRNGCGGRLHVHPIYGGLMEICERCQSDADCWQPRGTYLTETMVHEVGVDGSFVLGEIGEARVIIRALSSVLSVHDRPIDRVIIDSWLATHAHAPGADAVRALLAHVARDRVDNGERRRSHEEDMRRQDEDGRDDHRRRPGVRERSQTQLVPLASTILDRDASSDASSAESSSRPAQGLWLVTASDRDTGGTRRWVAIGATSEEVESRFVAMRMAELGGRREDYDAWRDRQASCSIRPALSKVTEIGEIGEG